MPDERWIVIPRWHEFQHYANRDPSWVKNYVRLTADDAYRGLSLHARGVLHGLWLEYARSNGQLLGSTAALTRRLGDRVTTATLDSLNHAGFIEFAASKPSRARSREEVLRTSKEAASKNAAASQKNSEPPRDPDAAAKARQIAERLRRR